MRVRTTRGYFSGLSRNTFLLALTSLFADVSTEMLVPILPIVLRCVFCLAAATGKA
jgi:hypothetical protein